MILHQSSPRKSKVLHSKIRHKRNTPLEISFFNVSSNNFNTIKLFNQNQRQNEKQILNIKTIKVNKTKESSQVSFNEDQLISTNPLSINTKYSKFKMKVSDYYMMFHTNPPDNIKEVQFREEFIKKKFNTLFQKTITTSDCDEDFKSAQTNNEDDLFIYKNKLPKGTNEWIPFYPCLDKDDMKKIRELKKIHLSNRNNFELYKLFYTDDLNLNNEKDVEKENKDRNNEDSKLRISKLVNEIKSDSIMKKSVMERKSLLTSLANEYNKKEKVDKSILRNTIDVFNTTLKLNIKEKKSKNQNFFEKKHEKNRFFPFSQIHFERKDIKQTEKRKTIKLSASVVKNNFKKGGKEKEKEAVSKEYSTRNIYQTINDDIEKNKNYKCNCEDCVEFKSLFIQKEKSNEEEIKNLKLFRLVQKENYDKNKISKNNTYTTDDLCIKNKKSNTKDEFGGKYNFKSMMSNFIKKNTLSIRNKYLNMKSVGKNKEKDEKDEKEKEKDWEVTEEDLKHIDITKNNINNNTNSYTYYSNNITSKYNTISQGNLTEDNKPLNTSKNKTSMDFNIKSERTNIKKNMKMIRMINKNPFIVNYLSDDFKLQSEIDYLKKRKYQNLASYNLQISNLFSKRLDFNNYQQLQGRLNMINKISSNEKVPISQKLILFK